MRESVIYQEILAEGRQEGLQEGRQQTLVEVATNLLRQGIAPEQVAAATGLDLTQVQNLQQHLQG